MNRLLTLFVTLLLLFLLGDASPARAAEDEAGSFFDRFGLASTTGQSPWLVIAGRGAKQYFTATPEQKERLGLTAHPAVFGTVAFLLLLVGIKDSLLTWMGPLKVPLDVLAEGLHFTGGVAGYFYLGDVAFNQPEGIKQFASAESSSYAMSVVSYLMMAVVHTAVWIAFNTIEVAIILCPFPLVDTCLKSFRTALIGLITGAAAIHPLLGFAIALPIVLICVIMVPFALRMGQVGWVFCWDVLGRWFGSGKLPERVSAFVSYGLGGVITLRYGTVVRNEDGSLTFSYRRLGFLWKRTAKIPAEAYVGIGSITPVLLVDEAGTTKQLLMFPPRYTKREQELAAQLGLTRVEDVSIGASFRATLRRIWGWMFGKRVEPGSA